MIRVESLLPDLESLVCHYAQRSGGVSEAPFASLNLGFSTGDDPLRVVENRRRLGEHLGAPLDHWIVAGQVHGADVVRPDRERRGEGAFSPSELFPAADALLLCDEDVFALTLGADCPSVIVADPVRRCVGVAHAGWRGTAAGVVQALVLAVVEAGSALTDLHAAVSPGICGGCYEVGIEVFAALAGQPGAAGARQGRQLDLRSIHRAALCDLGVAEGRVRVHPDCTACLPERYFSHRRDRGDTGRNGVLVGWRSRRGTS